jgi:hypothetical protein
VCGIEKIGDHVLVAGLKRVTRSDEAVPYAV